MNFVALFIQRVMNVLAGTGHWKGLPLVLERMRVGPTASWDPLEDERNRHQPGCLASPQKSSVLLQVTWVGSIEY